jgi:ABC-type amino acid transport/signal transduction systems, periplasmic component/domain
LPPARLVETFTLKPIPIPSFRQRKDHESAQVAQSNARRVFATLAATLAFTGLGALCAFPSAAHADALDNIAKSGTVRIGVFEDYPPFGSIGPDMKPMGYDIDVANLIGKALNAKVELVQVTGDNRMAYLADHKATCCCQSARRRNAKR